MDRFHQFCAPNHIMYKIMCSHDANKISQMFNVQIDLSFWYKISYTHRRSHMRYWLEEA